MWFELTSKLFFAKTGAMYLSRAYRRFGLGSGPIFLEHLSCSGEELSILDCPRHTLGLHHCDHTMDAGVQCFGNVYDLIGSLNLIEYLNSYR